MLITLPKFLAPEQLSKIDELMAGAPYVDGAATAGGTASRVKNNEQIDRPNAPTITQLDEIVVSALRASPTVRSAGLPLKIRAPLYNRYGVGMEYGPHVDNPVMMDETPIRTDISVTIFLSDVDTYDGGELVIGTTAGDAKVKLPKGDAVIYSTDALHKVEKITRGERLAAVTWIQSIVADPFRRQMLYELDIACQLVTKNSPESQEQRILHKTYGNLLRLWGEV